MALVKFDSFNEASIFILNYRQVNTNSPTQMPGKNQKIFLKSFWRKVKLITSV